MVIQPTQIPQQQQEQQQEQQQQPLAPRSMTDSARERRHQRIAALQRKDKASFSQRQQQQPHHQHQQQQQQQQQPLQLNPPSLVQSVFSPFPTSSSSSQAFNNNNNSGRRPPSPLAIMPASPHHYSSSSSAPSSPGGVGAIVSIEHSQHQQQQLSPSRSYSPSRQQHQQPQQCGAERGASPVVGVSSNRRSNTSSYKTNTNTISNSYSYNSTGGGNTRPPIRMVSPHGGVSGNNNSNNNNTNIMMPVLQQASSWDGNTGSHSHHHHHTNISPVSIGTPPPSPPRPSSFLALKRNTGSPNNNLSMNNNTNNSGPAVTTTTTTSDRSVASEGGFLPVHGNYHQQQQQQNNHHHYRDGRFTDRSMVSDMGGGGGGSGGDAYYYSNHPPQQHGVGPDADFMDGYHNTRNGGGGDHHQEYGDIPMDEQSDDHRSIGGGSRPYPGSPRNNHSASSSPPLPCFPQQPLLLPKSSSRPNSRGPPAVMVEMNQHPSSSCPRGGGGDLMIQMRGSISSGNSVVGGCGIVNARTSSQDADEVSSLGVGGLDEEQISANNSSSNNNSPRQNGRSNNGNNNHHNRSSSPSPPCNHNLLRLIAAVQTGEVTGGIDSVLGGSTLKPPPAPAHFSSEERILWEAIQTAIVNSSKQSTSSLISKQQHQQQQLPQQQQQSVTSTTEGSTSSELSGSMMSAERERLLQEKSTEQDLALRAIRRVLADVTDERDKAATELEEFQETVQAEKQTWQEQLEAKNQQIAALLEQQQAAPAASGGKSPRTPTETPNTNSTEVAELQEQIRALQSEKEHLNTEVDAKNKQLSKLKRHLHGTGTMNDKTDSTASAMDEHSQLRKELAEKSSALENAKMIIASLEQSSGSLASDTRFKLKAKDSEIAGLKRDASHQQKNLDTLATELRDVQTDRAKLEDRLSLDRNRVVSLKMMLEENMKELRDACVILETTRDSGDMDKISDILADAVEAFKKSIDALDDPNAPHNNDMDSIASARSMSSRASRENSAAINMTRDSSSVVRRMEEEMRKLKEDALHYRLEAERIEQQRESDKQTLYAEIQMLRVHCNTNMEVLTKKERELAVLRDSLRVEDDVGYISDDGDEDDDDDFMNNPPSTPTTTIVSQEYGHLQAEALATLLSHGSQSGSFDLGSMGGPQIQQQQQQQQSQPPPPPAPIGSPTSSKLKHELSQSRKERERAMKELKTEKESLANAKMIISSLERANKSMMEDLRSRLHDSNTAIASLLEKSMESEKSTAKLRAELESLRSEKERVEDEYEARLANLRRNAGATGGNNNSARGNGKSSSSGGALAIISMEEKKEDIITERID